MNARQLLRSAAEELRQAGVPDPEYDSGILLSEVIGRPHLELRAGMGPDPTEEQAARYAQLIARRKAREPLQYLLGSVIFRSREILTGPGALIPRPETEELTDLCDALEWDVSPMWFLEKDPLAGEYVQRSLIKENGILDALKAAKSPESGAKTDAVGKKTDALRRLAEIADFGA